MKPTSSWPIPLPAKSRRSFTYLTPTTGALAEGMTRAAAEAMAEDFSGHSLRAGHATSAAQNDAPGHAIQRQLRHKSFNTTAGYIREGRLFKGSSASFALSSAGCLILCQPQY